MADVAVRAVDLHKVYRSGHSEVRAVDGLSFSISRGEAFGLLGPNGAGKSTTVGMLTTRIRPTAGTVTVANADVAREPVEVKRRIGTVSQQNTLDRQLSVTENLEFRGRYAGFNRRESLRRGGELLERFGLSDRADAPVASLSGGQAQRVMICRALITRPEVLFLDEPTSGLDPQTRINLWELLSELRHEGQTVVLTTHYLEEAEALCERIAVVDHGTLVACDTTSALMRIGGDSSVTLGFRPGGDVAGFADSIRSSPDLSRVDVDGDTLRAYAPEVEKALPHLLYRSLQAGLVAVSMTLQRPTLESVFLALTGREIRE